MTKYEVVGSSYSELYNTHFCITFQLNVKLIVIVKCSFHLFPHSLSKFYLDLVKNQNNGNEDQQITAIFQSLFFKQALK